MEELKLNKKIKKTLAEFMALNLFVCSSAVHSNAEAKVSAGGLITSTLGASMASLVPRVASTVVTQADKLIRSAKKKIMVSKYSGFRPTQKIVDELKKICNDTSDIKIYGQEKAKKQMFDALSGVAARIDILKRQKADVKDTRGNIIYMTGPSGTGKTQMCYAIANAFLKHPEKTCIFCHSENITGEAELGTQLFKTVTTKDIGENRTKNWFTGSDGLVPKDEESPMLKHLLQWYESVVILDEYDKMKLKSAKPGTIMNIGGVSIPTMKGAAQDVDNSADEILRSIASTGKYKCMNKDINCEKTLFLITTNDKIEDLQSNFGIKGSEGGGMQRLNIVEFDYLTYDACKNIVCDMIKKVTRTLVDAEGPFKVSKVKFSEESKNLMADYMFNDKVMQGRAKNKLEDGIYSLMSKTMGKDYGKNVEITFEFLENDDMKFNFSKKNL